MPGLFGKSIIWHVKHDIEIFNDKTPLSITRCAEIRETLYYRTNEPRKTL